MRSYRKGYRSWDFKTITHLPPPGSTVTNPGENANDTDHVMAVAIFPARTGDSPFQVHNRLAAPQNWIGYDADGNPIDFVSGLVLANIVFNIQPYNEHPKN